MKLLSYVLGLAGGMAMLLAGCSKDSNPSTPVSTPSTSMLIGKWGVISGVDTRRYMVFNTDYTYDFLNEYSYGLRGVDTGIYQETSGTVDFGWYLYAYTVKNDTLTLSSPEQTIVAYRVRTSTTDTPWVKTAMVLDSLPAPINALTDISIQGDTLWYGNTYSTNHLFRIRISTRAVDTSLSVNVYAWAVEWDGANLWCSSDGQSSISRVNPTTGATLFTSRQMGAWIYGIAWDGTTLWCSSNNEDALYRYNPAGNVVLATLQLGVQPAGLAYANGHLYACVNGVINVCETTPFRTVGAYAIPNVEAFGIAYDGTNFWVSGSGRGVNRIWKVTLP